MNNQPRPALMIRHVDSAVASRVLVEEGFCPVECAFGTESVVDALCLDHHGRFGHLEGVAIRAWRDQRGARASDPRFVVTGAADADATFAIAALAGLLPDSLPGAGEVTMTSLAEMINRLDVHPIGLRAEESAAGRLVLLFKQLTPPIQDALAFQGGVDRWRWLCSGRNVAPLLQTVAEAERGRVATARQATATRVSAEVTFIESACWGFDVWYAEWSPVIVAYAAARGAVTVGCRDHSTAQVLFGNSGLAGVFPHLNPPGWGGRDTVGGSPRHARLPREVALAAASTIAGFIRLAASGPSVNIPVISYET